MAKRGMNGNAAARTATSANLGFEAKLWLAADKLRNNMDAAEYKHVVLGLIFLKYISDSFEEHHARLVEGKGEFEGADPEERDEYLAHNVFWVPKEARWPHLQANAKQPTIGKLLDDAMVAIERDNARVKGVLPKNYARPALDKHRLGELIDLIGTIQLSQPSPPAPLPEGEGGRRPGEGVRRDMDILGRVFEYFLKQFASAEGKNGGQFYTPSSVVRVLVEMLSPYKGRVYDPCCGSGGMFVQSEKFVEAHGGRIGDIAIYGQESNATTRNLAVMNLAVRGIEADFGPEQADTFRRDLHKDLRAQFVLANPPFNDSDWHRVDDDVRWQYGTPPKGNANFAWVQHFIHHLAPDGMAGFVLTNGSMSSNQSGEGDIRKAIIEADLVDCMVAMPGQLFYSTQIPVCLWFLTRNKSGHTKHPSPSGRGAGGEGRGAGGEGRGAGGEGRGAGGEGRGAGGEAREAGGECREQGEGRLRDRRRQTLFIDARKMGTLVDRVHRELTDADIAKIADTYHAWRSDNLPHPSPLPKGEGGAKRRVRGEGQGVRVYSDLPGFCKSATTDEIASRLPSPTGRGAGGEGGRAGDEGATPGGGTTEYRDIPGFCRAATTEEIASHGYVLTPGRYVGTEEVEDDGEPFEDKMTRLVAVLNTQFAESAKLEKAIKANLKGLGYGG